MENLLRGSSLLLVLPHRGTSGEMGGIRHAEPSFTRSSHSVPRGARSLSASPTRQVLFRARLAGGSYRSRRPMEGRIRKCLPLFLTFHVRKM